MDRLTSERVAQLCHELDAHTTVPEEEVLALRDLALRALSQDAVREEALMEFPVELMSYSMDDDKRIMARKILRLKRVEKAYCAANDYINALTGTAAIPPESLEKIKAAYWQAVREVQ